MSRLADRASAGPRTLNILIALAIASTSSGLAAQPVALVSTAAWKHRYLYQSTENVNGSRTSGYSTRFEIQAVRGEVFARILSTFQLTDGAWRQVTPTPACRKAMKGNSRHLADARLYPMDSGAGRNLGASFLADCAPPAIFYPLTDILNVILIPLSEEFRASELKHIGDRATFRGFTAAFARGDREFFEQSEGGETRLAGMDDATTVFEWYPEVAQLKIIDRSKQPSLVLEGTELWAFSVAVRRSTGALESASTIFDELDLKARGAAAGASSIHISRTVTIRRE